MVRTNPASFRIWSSPSQPASFIKYSAIGLYLFIRWLRTRISSFCMVICIPACTSSIRRELMFSSVQSSFPLSDISISRAMALKRRSYLLSRYFITISKMVVVSEAVW
ncbi:MAG: hypothetical protein L6262_05000 [Weeksellaceae bacterium]|nr:hypothetical protein [Weeksellaceae bacterium]